MIIIRACHCESGPHFSSGSLVTKACFWESEQEYYTKSTQSPFVLAPKSNGANTLLPRNHPMKSGYFFNFPWKNRIRAKRTFHIRVGKSEPCFAMAVRKCQRSPTALPSIHCMSSQQKTAFWNIFFCCCNNLAVISLLKCFQCFYEAAPH